MSNNYSYEGPVIGSNAFGLSILSSILGNSDETYVPPEPKEIMVTQVRPDGSVCLVTKTVAHMSDTERLAYGLKPASDPVEASEDMYNSEQSHDTSSVESGDESHIDEDDIDSGLFYSEDWIFPDSVVGELNDFIKKSENDGGALSVGNYLGFAADECVVSSVAECVKTTDPDRLYSLFSEHIDTKQYPFKGAYSWLRLFKHDVWYLILRKLNKPMIDARDLKFLITSGSKISRELEVNVNFSHGYVYLVHDGGFRMDVQEFILAFLFSEDLGSYLAGRAGDLVYVPLAGYRTASQVESYVNTFYTDPGALTFDDIFDYDGFAKDRINDKSPQDDSYVYEGDLDLTIGADFFPAVSLKCRYSFFHSYSRYRSYVKNWALLFTSTRFTLRDISEPDKYQLFKHGFCHLYWLHEQFWHIALDSGVSQYIDRKTLQFYIDLYENCPHAFVDSICVGQTGRYIHIVHQFGSFEKLPERIFYASPLALMRAIWKLCFG